MRQSIQTELQKTNILLHKTQSMPPDSAAGAQRVPQLQIASLLQHSGCRLWIGTLTSAYYATTRV